MQNVPVCLSGLRKLVLPLKLEFTLPSRLLERTPDLARYTAAISHTRFLVDDLFQQREDAASGARVLSRPGK
jgi:hypothetical protein